MRNIKNFDPFTEWHISKTNIEIYEQNNQPEKTDWKMNQTISDNAIRDKDQLGSLKDFEYENTLSFKKQIELAEILNNPEDVNLETRRKHRGINNYKTLKSKGELISNFEQIYNELTTDWNFQKEENLKLKETIDKQKEAINNFQNRQKQQQSRIDELENEIQDLLEQFGSQKLDDEIQQKIEEAKDHAKELKDEIDRQGNVRSSEIKETADMKQNISSKISTLRNENEELIKKIKAIEDSRNLGQDKKITDEISNYEQSIEASKHLLDRKREELVKIKNDLEEQNKEMSKVVRPELIMFRKKQEKLRASYMESQVGPEAMEDPKSTTHDGSQSTHDLFINRTKLHKHYTQISLKNKSLSSSRLQQSNDSVNLTKQRPYSAMDSQLNRDSQSRAGLAASKAALFNFTSNKTILTEDQIISRKEKAFKTQNHIRNQLNIETKLTRELETKLQQSQFRNSEFKDRMQSLIEDCKKDHGEINNVNIKYYLERILNDHYILDATGHPAHRFEFIPNDQLIAKSRKAREVNIKNVTNRTKDTTSEQVDTNRKDDLRVLGQTKVVNSKRVDIKFPEDPKDKPLTETEVEMFNRQMNMDSNFKRDISQFTDDDIKKFVRQDLN